MLLESPTLYTFPLWGFSGLPRSSSKCCPLSWGKKKSMHNFSNLKLRGTITSLNLDATFILYCSLRICYHFRWPYGRVNLFFQSVDIFLTLFFVMTTKYLFINWSSVIYVRKFVPPHSVFCALNFFFSFLLLVYMHSLYLNN
jgi:hypothetical protein